MAEFDEFNEGDFYVTVKTFAKEHDMEPTASVDAYGSGVGESYSDIIDDPAELRELSEFFAQMADELEEAQRDGA